MFLAYFRVRENAIRPSRANPSDAGLDVFYCPTDIQSIELKSGENHLFETGLKFGVPHGYVLMVCNRGGMGAKRSLVYGAHIIDPGYDGEVFIDLHNIGPEAQIINPGDKIAQLLLVPAIPFRAQECNEDALYDYPIAISDREDGKLGSTG